MRKYLLPILIALLLLGGGAYWSLMQPPRCMEGEIDPPPLRITRKAAPGKANGHLVGIQPFMEPADYACAARFEGKLRAYLDALQREGCLTERTIVVFPEYIGTWLVLLGEPAGTFRAQTLEGALTWAVLRQPWRFWRAYRTAGAEGWTDPSAVAAFRLKAPEMARTFHETFSKLARAYQITIVAGSIVLPGARIESDSLIVQPSEALENVSLLYRPDGKPDPQIVRKAFPIAMELGFTRPGEVTQLPVYKTPLGRLGILICADSWFPQSYEALGQIDLLAVPSYLMGDSCWTQPWRGYSGWDAPADVQLTSLREGEAWLTYAMGGRLPRYDSTATGVNVFLRGRFWELGADGRLVSVTQGNTEALETDILCLSIQGSSPTP